MHLARIAILLQLFHCFFCMLLFLRDKYNLRSIVLQEMSCDTKADASGSPRNYVDLSIYYKLALGVDNSDEQFRIAELPCR